MRAVVLPDFPTFADRVLTHLLADPVRNNVASTLVQNRLDGVVPTEPDGLWAWVHDTEGELVGIALATPPYGILLSDMPPVAVDALVARLAVGRPGLPTVNGPLAASARFAREYAEATGTTSYPGMSFRMFRLDSVEPPIGVPGGLREATAADRDLLVRWSAAFGAEALPDGPHDDAARPIDLRLGQPGLLWVWEVGGTPVSTAYLSRPAAGVSRVSGVYTPPALRGRGYASACVAAMSQRALDAGSIACMLYTDLANPTSNKIYQAIGYRPVGDTQEWRFR